MSYLTGNGTVKDDMILFEGRYDALTGKISQGILKSIKDAKRSYSDYFFLRGVDVKATKDLEETDANIEVRARINYRKNTKASHSVEGISDPDKAVILTINIDNKYFPMAYNDLLADIKEVVRHEIEHVTQEIFKKIPASKKKTVVVGGSIYEYLTSQDEVEAFTHGLYKKAKTIKKPWIDVARESLNKDYSGYLSKKEIDNVLAIWSAFAKKASLLGGRSSRTMDWGKES